MGRQTLWILILRSTLKVGTGLYVYLQRITRDEGNEELGIMISNGEVDAMDLDV
jgi:hypothetical protein